MEQIKEQVQRKAIIEYEKFIADKKRMDSKQLCIDAYEGVLYHKRSAEKDILNKKRFTEYERNRPPADKWFELKTVEF